MTRGRNICNQLKYVRKRIAEENGIPLELPWMAKGSQQPRIGDECSFTGECRGTCPRCEAELRYIESTLADILRKGKMVTVAGVALGLASCGNGPSGDEPDSIEYPLEGEPVDPALTSDTKQKTTDTARLGWRNPPDMSDVYLGGLDVMDINDTAILQEEGGVDDEPLMGCIADPEPEFPGGIEALYKFITDNLKYPQLALENGIEGRVYLNFVIDTDGTVSNVRVMRDIGGGCGREAKRVVEMMPKWFPAKQRGKPVRTPFNLPVNFVLPEDRPRIIEGGASPVMYEDRTQGIPMDSSANDISPYSPTQKMEIEGVKVIVK